MGKHWAIWCGPNSPRKGPRPIKTGTHEKDRCYTNTLATCGTPHTGAIYTIYTHHMGHHAQLYIIPRIKRLKADKSTVMKAGRRKGTVWWGSSCGKRTSTNLKNKSIIVEQKRSCFFDVKMYFSESTERVAFQPN